MPTSLGSTYDETATQFGTYRAGLFSRHYRVAKIRAGEAGDGSIVFAGYAYRTEADATQASITTVSAE